MGKLFISYSTKNQKIAKALCDYLERQGLRCWIAPRDIPSASNYAGEITRAIKSAEAFLLIYSKDAGKSEHVKNEINLAINNTKRILPYCLDDSPYDDDLEYYLATRQRIASSGDQEQDFQNIATVLLGHPVEHPQEKPGPAVPKTEKTRKPGVLYAVVGALLLIALCAWFFFLRPAPQPNPASGGTPVDSLSVDTTALVVKERKDTVKTQTPPVRTDTKTTKDTTADTFTGTIKNGYPDGYGTYTFKKSRRIDMHDPGKRVAQAGDYIVGEWNNGHLNYGEWYGSDGVKKEFIELGDNADFQADHSFAKCVKP